MKNNFENEERSDSIENNYVNNKELEKGKIIFPIVILSVILILFGLITWVVKPWNVSLKDDSKNKIELLHADVVSTKSNGIYITDVSEIAADVMPSIVAITSKTIINSERFGSLFYGSGKYVSEGAGSGVIIAENSDEIYILTNYHVVKNASELSVSFIDEESYDATIKGISENVDIAVVSVKKEDIKTETLEKIKIATLGDSNQLKVGNGIIAIGNALGYGQSVTTGIVSALNREITTDEYVQKMIQIDAAINGGNSGGALINSSGQVVGINTAKYSSSSSTSIEGMGFAIPISSVENIIEDLINGENNATNLSLGIEGYMTNSSEMVNYRLPVGVYVSSIINGGNAYKTDLDIGNIITEIDGNKITSLDVIKKVLNKKEKGDKVTLKVQYPSRNEYKEKVITITLN